MTMTDLLDLGSDRALRRRFFTEASYQHPAKMHVGLLLYLAERFTAPGQTVLDPMCGIGTTLLAALLQRDVVGYEIEPLFLKEAHRNAARITDAAGLFAGQITVAAQDARETWPHQADVVLFSPPYGCDAQRRATRTTENLTRRLLRLGRKRAHLSKRWEQLARAGQAHPGAGAIMAFAYGEHPAQLGHLRGAKYWTAMTAVYTQAGAALRPGGSMVLVIKDHIKDGRRVHVADQTVDCCERLGLHLVDHLARRVWPLSLWQRRRKERGEPVIEEEDVLVFTTGERRC